jgi:dolichol-phosphate mannosyltransferase
MSKDVAVIIPVYNEKDNLNELTSRLLKTVSSLTRHFEIIFVNDGSDDGSLEAIKALSQQHNEIFYINLTRNYGHQVAVSAGLKYCNSEAVITIDADLQDPPELITEMFKEYEKGYDVVNARRKQRKGESLLKRGTAKLYYRLLKRLVPFEIPLDTGDYRLISKKVVEALNQMPEQNKYLRGQIAWLGFKTSTVAYERESRKYGESGYTYSKMFKLAIDGITGYSDSPLWLVSRMGFVIALLSFLFIIYAIFAHFVLEQTITGWTSIIVSATFLGGIQLFSIGIIGEYIARINTNVKRRPLFMVESTNMESQNAKSSNP